ncbi:hypothetical protein ONS95_001936 [Cadophora gregata]|uniref:uncharacterized protein n=1 Tax=Cadophora gregata TaxID=51156 RepID=UPI0026DBF949|nr:uncharacterized protein ONS95_001936 [Cadophora gregata]KAK0111587.1 hypothetical protein ONS95_001936 [Cadophora gregata]KAK0111937.1 hypothetical protein ONS96_001201 [Cadophora gregata f. sp. sojae]
MPSNEAHVQYVLPPRHHGHDEDPPRTRRAISKRVPAHYILSWSTLILAITCYVLTSLYAWHPEVISHEKIFGGSPSRALRVLTVLSTLANWILAATISQSFDLMWGMLLARKNGLCLLSGLALQPGTSLDGQAEIICKKHQGGMKPRAWSVFKVLSMTIIPILGIVVLRDVEAIPIFYQKTSDPVAKAYSVGAFNATLATILQPLTDGSFGTRYKDFLSDPDLVREVSTNADRKGCSIAHFNDTKVPCRSKFLIPGGIEQFAPQSLNAEGFSGSDDVQPVLAKNLRGLYLEFEQNNGSVTFDQKTDCIRQGYRLGAYQLCLKDVGANQIATYLTPCPKSLAANMACMSNATWPTDKGWGTTLSTYTRLANVTYNGLNGTIMDHKFSHDTPTPVQIAAPELLQVFQVLFSPADPNTKYGQFLSRLGIVSNRPVEPLTIWQYFQGLTERSETDKRVNRQAMMGLQSLLAIPIYHCQAKDFAELRRLLLSQIDNSPILETLGVEIVSSFPAVEPDTDIYPAIMRWTLDVGRPSLLAYIILAGTTLSLCIMANVMATFTDVGRRSKHMGSFLLLTHLCDCETTYRCGAPFAEGTEVPLEHFRDLEAGQRLTKAAKMQVKMTEGKAQNTSEGLRCDVRQVEVQIVELTSRKEVQDGETLFRPKTT